MATSPVIFPKKDMHMLVDAMGLQNPFSSTKMTPYRFGLAINTLSSQHDSSLSDTQRETLRHKYRSYLGMLNWFSISTQPNLTTVHGLLASATESPSPAHLDAL
jgi:membrane protein required for beta-lactamase induction